MCAECHSTNLEKNYNLKTDTYKTTWSEIALAEKNYKAATKIDQLSYPAKVNLGMLYDGLGKKEEAERLFREVVRQHPELYDAAYSLGLLLVERKNYQEAVEYLKKAADGMPERARVHYNLGHGVKVIHGIGCDL